MRQFKMMNSRRSSFSCIFYIFIMLYSLCISFILFCVCFLMYFLGNPVMSSSSPSSSSSSCSSSSSSSSYDTDVLIFEQLQNIVNSEGFGILPLGDKASTLRELSAARGRLPAERTDGFVTPTHRSSMKKSAAGSHVGNVTISIGNTFTKGQQSE